MSPLPFGASLALALGALTMLVSHCGEPLPAADDPAARLPGTWLREYQVQDVKVRRVLRLEPGGAFQEAVRAVDGAGQVSEQAHEGTWLYDGTNLKRRYTMMNGKPPSRLNLPFATFEIRFESRNDFTGVDHIHRNQVHYWRVPADTLP